MGKQNTESREELAEDEDKYKEINTSEIARTIGTLRGDQGGWRASEKSSRKSKDITGGGKREKKQKEEILSSTCRQNNCVERPLS